MTPADVLTLVPMVPILFVAITWILPWERWIPWGELPLHVLGLYLLYAAFAFWHFKFPRWTVVLLVIAGTSCFAVYVRRKVENRRPIRS